MVYVYGSQLCGSFESNSLSTGVADWFYNLGFLKDAYSQCKANVALGITGPNASGILPTGGVIELATNVNTTANSSTNQTFSTTATAATSANSGVVGAFIGGGVAFLDLIKMVVSFAAMLVGLPVPFILASLGVNYIFVLFILTPIEALFIIGVIEFLRGSSF